MIVRIKITWFEKGIYLDQSNYVEMILKKYNYFNCKPSCTPYDLSVELFKSTCDSVTETEYDSIIGRLRYATDCTRHDIACRRIVVHVYIVDRVMRICNLLREWCCTLKEPWISVYIIRYFLLYLKDTMM